MIDFVIETGKGRKLAAAFDFGTVIGNAKGFARADQAPMVVHAVDFSSKQVLGIYSSYRTHADLLAIYTELGRVLGLVSVPMIYGARRLYPAPPEGV